MKPGRSKKPIGELLVAEELITQGQLLEALANRTVIDGRRERLGETIQRLGFVAPEDMARIIAFQFGLEHVDEAAELPTPAMASVIVEDIARAHRVVPWAHLDEGVLVLTTDPGDPAAVEALADCLDGAEATLVVGSATLVDRALATVYAAQPAEQPHVPVTGDPHPEAPAVEYAPAVDDAPAQDGLPDDAASHGPQGHDESDQPHDDTFDDNSPAFTPPARSVVEIDLPPPLDVIVGTALGSDASQVVISPDGIRHRVHGALSALIPGDVPADDVAAAVRRAGGVEAQGVTRVTLTANAGPVMWRVDCTILPTVRGEKTTLNLAPGTLAHRQITELALGDAQAELIERHLRRRGVIHVVAGPTRSGRTATVSAMAAAIAADGRDVTAITVDAPSATPGVDWVRAASPATVAALAETAVQARTDALVIDVPITADNVAAALTAARRGAGVILVAHADDVADALVQLAALAPTPASLGSMVGLVVAQRLARSLCAACAQPSLPTGDEARLLDLTSGESNDAGWRAATGCHLCAGTGFGGQVALAEVVALDDAMQRAARQGADVDDVRALVQQSGIQTLPDVAIEAGLAGTLTPADIVRLIQPAAPTPAAQAKTTPAPPAPVPTAPVDEAPLGPLPRRTRSAPAPEAARSLFGSARAQQADGAADVADDGGSRAAAEEFDPDAALATARLRLEQMLQGID